MSDHPRRPDERPAFDPRETPVPRRRVLVLMGVGAIAATGGLGSVLAACAGPPVTVRLDVDPDTLVPGTPVEVPFTVTQGTATTDGSTWLIKKASGDLVAYDPRCTHGLCRYRWSTTAARFSCGCHDGQFALDGTVLTGPPPRALDQFPVRIVDGVVEVDVPGDFETPRESLPA